MSGSSSSSPSPASPRRRGKGKKRDNADYLSDLLGFEYDSLLSLWDRTEPNCPNKPPLPQFIASVLAARLATSWTATCALLYLVWGITVSKTTLRKWVLSCGNWVRDKIDPKVRFQHRVQGCALATCVVDGTHVPCRLRGTRSLRPGEVNKGGHDTKDTNYKTKVYHLSTTNKYADQQSVLGMDGLGKWCDCRLTSHEFVHFAKRERDDWVVELEMNGELDEPPVSKKSRKGKK